ncbi:hypothetical protein LCM20_10170 [Halobacillus litoralis]|uniref:hypothetical protein n=1 Tax=Halobacillus litoralis TaxID=45668 RepID=UPI001CD6BDD8|nr:hypothetical protein [Halobacillus litoralis]MCA0970956.1 hypothetical protein [Halobacillus litoralis]
MLVLTGCGAFSQATPDIGKIDEQPKTIEDFPNLIEGCPDEGDEEAKDAGFSEKEMRKMQDRIADEIFSEDSLTGDKITRVGNCNLGQVFRLEAWTHADEEELEWLNSIAEVPLAINVREPNGVTGYVTSISQDGEALVDMTWFGNMPEGMKVGDRVEVAYNMVQESFPGQSYALEAEILPDEKPEAADLTTSEAIRQGIEKVDRQGDPLSVKKVKYDESKDQWTVLFRKGHEGEAEVEVED